MFRAKRNSIVALMYVASTAIGIEPGLANPDVEKAKLQLKQVRKDKYATRSNLVICLLELANAYYRAGEYTNSERTLKSLLRAADDEKEERLPSMYSADLILNWAQNIKQRANSYPKSNLNNDDTKRINSALDEAFKRIQAIPCDASVANICFEAIELLQGTSNTEGAREWKEYILSYCRKIESNKSASRDELQEAATIFERLSYYAMKIRVPFDIPTHTVSLSSTDDRQNVLTVKNFQECESLRLRGVALTDRLKKDDPYRFSAHKSLALFYMLFGKTDKAKEQVQILSDIAGTSDEKKLFPKYLGCGSYEGHVLAQLCGCG